MAKVRTKLMTKERKENYIRQKSITSKKERSQFRKSLQTIKTFSYFKSRKNSKFLKNDEWLSDEVMVKACELLFNQYPELKGLQDPVCGQKTFKSVYGDSMQIHHDGVNHWVLSVALKGKIYIYDSLNCTTTENLQRQLSECYKGFIVDNKLIVEFPSIGRQLGGNDCGLFVIAFAVDIANGESPENFFYRRSEMRKHFLDCIEIEELLPFPRLSFVEAENKLRKPFNSEVIKVSCFCLTPASGNMLVCSLCEGDFHETCVSKDIDFEKFSLSDWLCKDCAPPNYLF